MKNILYFFLLSFMIALVFSCAKDEAEFAMADQDTMELRAPALKVDVCHFDEETGEYHTINISMNAVPAHMAHGDYMGECTDCDPDCLFCQYLDLFDFSLDCYEYYPNYCDYDYYYDNNMYGWYAGIYFDDYYDYYYCEGDYCKYGWIEIYNDYYYGEWYHYVYVYYDDYCEGVYINDYNEVTTEVAESCRESLADIALANNLINQCAERPNANNNDDDKVQMKEKGHLQFGNAPLHDLRKDIEKKAEEKSQLIRQLNKKK